MLKSSAGMLVERPEDNLSGASGSNSSKEVAHAPIQMCQNIDIPPLTQAQERDFQQQMPLSLIVLVCLN
jgi:hypothetical protein